MQLSVIIPTYKREKILQRTLDCLIPALKNFTSEILVINDSEDEVKFEKFDGKVYVFRNPQKGAASARNFGVSKAQSKMLLFLDDDVLVNEKNILRIFELHAAYEKSAFNFHWYFPEDLIAELPKTSFGRYLFHKKIYSQESRLIDKNPKTKNGLVENFGIASYFFSIEKEVFLSCDGYDESIPFAGVEDIILSKKLRDKGVNTFLSLSDVVFHNESDRMDLWQVMERYSRASITMNAAVKSGHTEFDRKFRGSKKNIYSLCLPFRKPLYYFSKSIPNLKIFDLLYFKLVNLLLGVSSYKGYKESR